MRKAKGNFNFQKRYSNPMFVVESFLLFGREEQRERVVGVNIAKGDGGWSAKRLQLFRV